MTRPPSIALTLLLGLACAWGASAQERDVSLADALKTIQRSTYVDLTHRFSPTIPVWSGFGQATFAPAADPKTNRPYTVEEDGFRSTLYTLVGQYGTHVDPPAHFDADGETMDNIPLEEMILPLVVFNITPLLDDDPGHAVTVADILAWEAEHGRIPPRCFAALRTDMYKDWETNQERFKRNPFPAWSLEAVQFLVEQRDVVAIGHESLDTDASPTLEAETWLLQNDRWQIEAMAQLDKVPTTGAIIVVTWPKVQDGLGFPARAFAIVPKE